MVMSLLIITVILALAPCYFDEFYNNFFTVLFIC